jgi:Tol biopolymer transport system component
MAPDPDALYEHISRAVADGDSIDWDSLAVDTQTRATLQQLKVLAEVARLHRDTLPDPGSCAAVPPPVRVGDVWGHLTVRGELGRGARGYVFRAWDPQLDREVALKLSVDRDGDRASKDVISEAKLLARVKHPHVATVFGAERSAGLVGHWMELVEGETLEAKLLRVGRFNPREVALMGIDVCSALSAVHAAGLLHRDVKAQNVMRDRNGRLVLMDFGTGRDLESAEGAFVHDEVGTPMYMAPELFDGVKASVQSDIYSVGVLLYRLVTGSVPVEAHSPESLKAAHHARSSKSLADARSDLPLAFIRVVERALAHDPRDRYASAGALEMALSGLLVPMESHAQPRTGGGRLLTAGAALGALVMGLALGAWAWTSRTAPAPEVRFPLMPVGAREEVQSVALSPDGSRIAFTSAGRLHVRRMNDVGAVEVEQTQGARDPFWSPDGQWIGFFKGTSVWRVRAGGGEPQALAAARRPSSGSWGTDGTLLYTIEFGTTIVAVPAGGGTPRPVRTQRTGLRTHLAWPAWVGTGQHFVYSAISARTGKRALYLARTADGVDAPDRELGDIASNVLVVGTRVVFVSAGQLKAQRLDVAAGTLVGEPVTLADGVLVDPYGSGDADFSVARQPSTRWSSSGPDVATLAYVGTNQGAREMRVVDATGATIGRFEPADTRDMRLSPNGRLVAFEEVDPETGTREIWVDDLVRRSRIRLTQHAADDTAPLWSPDSRTVYFLSSRLGRLSLYGVSASGGPRESRLFDFAGQVVPYEITPDGRSVVYQQLDQQGGWDIWLCSLDGASPTPLVQSAHNDREPAISPDGRHLAYSTPESGGQQVWVMPLPADGRRIRVSSDYGREPTWSADGRTLYYHGLNRTLMRVAVETSGPTPSFGTPRGLFTIPFRGFDMRFHFAVLPAPDRFLVNVPLDTPTPASATIILNAALP